MLSFVAFLNAVLRSFCKPADRIHLNSIRWQIVEQPGALLRYEHGLQQMPVDMCQVAEQVTEEITNGE